MNKRSKRYTDEFKMLILELLEDGRTKKSLENGKKNLKET